MYQMHNDLLKNYFKKKAPKSSLASKETAQEQMMSEKQKEVLEEYKKMREESTLLEVSIHKGNKNGDLVCKLKEGFIGTIPADEVGANYTYRQRSKYVGESVYVTITSISPDNKILLSKKMGDTVANDLIRQHVRQYKKGMKVKGKIQFYNKDTERVYLDLGGKFLGYIPISQWTHGFVHDIEEEVEELKKNGESIIEVAIEKYKPAKGKYNECFICSRKAAIKNPWEGIEERYERNDIIEGTCNDMQAKKFYCPIEDGSLDVYCEYPSDKKDGNGNVTWTAPKIKIGGHYKLRIYKVNEEQKILRARVIQEIIK